MRVFAQRCQSSSLSSSKSFSSNSWRAEQAIREWLNSKERPHYSMHTLHRHKLSELFTLLPTRSFEYPFMNLRPFPPSNGHPISLGSYFGLFPDSYDNAPVKRDGTQAWHAPHTFARRLRHGGRVVMRSKSPPVVGMNFIKKAIHLDSKETRAAPSDTHILRTRRKMVMYQWFPMKTELLTEECVTAFYNDKYSGSIESFIGLPKPTERFLSYTFRPTRRRLREFAMFFQDTHKIHYDFHYAKSEGYPDLVVGTPLQLTIILDIMQAYTPKGLTCNAIDYRVINPLFCDGEIRVFRHWYQKDPPSSLNDLSPDMTVLVNQEDSRGTSPQRKEEPAAHQTNESPNIPRLSGLAHVILWTENENGVVGTVVLAALVKNSKASWELDSQTGYVLPVGSTWPLDQTNTGQKPAIYHFAEDLDDKIVEPDTFDSLGRPISRHPNRPLRAWPSRHPWQRDDDDGDDEDADSAAVLEFERQSRKQFATQLKESRNLLGNFDIRNDDNLE